MPLDPTAVTDRPGAAWCRRWTDEVDEFLAARLAQATDGKGVALVALGSYARRELCPGSDIDILLLHSGWSRAPLEDLVQSVCYPLWDAGLSVGHAVRSPKEAVKAAGDRIDTATALTDRRLVAGDSGLLDDVAARLARWLRRNAAKVLGQLSAADAARYRQAGMHAGMLEPDLKNGAGGLRDIHSLRWASAVLLGEVGLDPLVGGRYLGAADRRELAAAGKALLEARCALHLATARPGGKHGADLDRLRLDLQDEVATVADRASADDLLREVGLAMRAVSHIHGRTWPLLLADATRGRRRGRAAAEPVADGVVVHEGLVDIAADHDLVEDPSLPWRAAAVAARRGARLGRSTVARLELHATGDTRLPWNATSRGAFINVLHQGQDALPVLADLDHVGILSAAIPEWSRVRGRPQRNPFHRFDLDTHGFAAVAELHAIAGGALDASHARLWDGLAEPDALLVGTLLHDVGKAWPGDHSVAGAKVARTWVSAMGFEPPFADRVGRFVRAHLLLPDVAQHRDLDDEREIARVAAAVEDTETLDGLYLLSLADARATGPAAHSPWKDQLLAELHARVRRYLKEGRAAAPDEAVIAEARSRLLGSGAAGELDRLLEGAPRGYLSAADAEQLVSHAELLSPPPRPGELRARIRPGPAEQTLVVSLVAADRRGLFADCAGVLAAHGIEVLDVRAFTREDGVALDWFVVRPDPHMEPERVVDDLRRAAGGVLDVADLIARRERRRDERPNRHHALVPTTVRFAARGDRWRVEVRGPDAPGVLYRLAHALAGNGLDVEGVRASTLGPEVRDVFFVRTLGAPPDTHELSALLTEAAGFPDELLA